MPLPPAMHGGGGPMTMRSLGAGVRPHGAGARPHTEGGLSGAGRRLRG